MSKNTFCVILGPFFSFFASAGLATSASSARPIKSACVVRIFHRRNDVEADKKKKHEDFFQVLIDGMPSLRRRMLGGLMSRRLLCLAVLAGSCVAYVPVQVSCFEDPSQASCR